MYQSNTYNVSVCVQLSPVALTELLLLQGTQSLNPHNDYCQHFVDTGHRPQNFIRDVGMSVSQPKTVWRWLIGFSSTCFSSPFLIPYSFWEVQIHKLFLVFFCLHVHTCHIDIYINGFIFSYLGGHYYQGCSNLGFTWKYFTRKIFFSNLSSFDSRK